MHSSKKVHPLAQPKMLKDYLREELGPCSPQKSSSELPFLDNMLAKAFKAVSRSRWASSFRSSSCGVCHGEARVKTALLKVKDIVWRASLWDMAEGMPCGQSGLSRNTSCSDTSSGKYSSSSWHESCFDEEFPLTWWEYADQKHKGDPITRVFDLEETWRSFSVMEKKDDKGQKDGPVSVIGFWFGDEEELYIKDWSRGIEERLSVVREDRGRNLLSLIEPVRNPPIISKPHEKEFLLDEYPSDGLEQKTMDAATSWMKWAIGGRGGAYVEEMDKVGGWTGFVAREEEEMMVDAEGEVLDGLIREMVVEMGVGLAAYLMPFL